MDRCARSSAQCGERWCHRAIAFRVIAAMRSGGKCRLRRRPRPRSVSLAAQCSAVRDRDAFRDRDRARAPMQKSARTIRHAVHPLKGEPTPACVTPSRAETACPLAGWATIAIFEEQRQKHVIRRASATRSNAARSWKEIPHQRLIEGGIVPQNLGKIFARENGIGATNQSSQEAIQLLQVHRTFVSKALKKRAQASEFLLGQRLRLHGLRLLS